MPPGTDLGIVSPWIWLTISTNRQIGFTVIFLSLWLKHTETRVAFWVTFRVYAALASIGPSPTINRWFNGCDAAREVQRSEPIITQKCPGEPGCAQHKTYSSPHIKRWSLITCPPATTSSAHLRGEEAGDFLCGVENLKKESKDGEQKIGEAKQGASLNCTFWFSLSYEGTVFFHPPEDPHSVRLCVPLDGIHGD